MIKQHHSFRYFFREGLENLRSHGFMTFAAIGITVACLLIMGTFTLVAVNVDAMLEELEQENEIVAFVDETYNDTQAKALESKLEKLPNVTSATYISREEAAKNFAAKHPEEELFQNLDPQILRARYTIRIDDLTRMGTTVEQVRRINGIADINAQEEVAGGFITVRNVATVVCVALIAILFIVSVFIMSNTIRLTTFERREEIAIMRMVGATKGFIRWPFVYEGFMMGLLGALLAFGMQWGIYEAVAQGVSNNDTLQLISIVPFQQMWKTVAITFGGAGVIIGVGGSLSAIRKFLQV